MTGDRQFLTIGKSHSSSNDNLVSIAKSEIETSLSKNKPELFQKLFQKAGIILPKVNSLQIKGYLEKPNIRIAKVYVEQASICFESHKFDEAIAICQQALARYSNLPEAHKIWGNCLVKMNCLSEAIGQYAKALEINPDMEEAYANIGSILAKRKQRHKAIDYYHLALSINPHSAAVYFNLARLWEELGEGEKSEKCLFKGIELNPRRLTPQQYWELGEQFIREEKIERAIVCYLHAVELDPTSNDAYFKLIETLENSSNYQGLVEYYPRIIALTVPENSANETLPQNKISRLLAPAKNQTVTVLPTSQPTLHRTRLSLPSVSSPNHLQPSLNSSTSKDSSPISQNSQKAKLHFQRGSLFANNKRRALAINKAKSQNLTSDARIESDSHRSLDTDSEFTLVADTPELIKLKQAIAQEPHNSWNYHHLGQALLEQGKLDEALTQFYRAIELEPEASWNYDKIAKILCKQNKLEEAIAPCRKLIELEPEHVWGYFEQGEILLRLERWSEAVEAYLCAYNLEPNELVFSQRLGDIFYRLGSSYVSEAIKYYLRVIELTPSHIDIYHRLIELAPENPEFHLMLANLFVARNEWNAAIVFYQIVLQLAPNCDEAYFHLGELYQKQQQWQQAISFYQTAVELEPNRVEYQYQLGEALEQFGYLPEAIHHYHRAIKLKPELLGAQQSLGDALMKQEAWTEALSAYKIAQKLAPESPIIYKRMGDILAKQNKIAAASKAYLCAVERGFKLF